MEVAKEELETKIACEKLAKPKISAEFMTFWLHRFRKLDVRQKSHKKILIDTFINAIFLYDDKMVITFNYKEGTDTITFDDLKASPAAEKSGSDLDCLTAPQNDEDVDDSASVPPEKKHPYFQGCFFVLGTFVYAEGCHQWYITAPFQLKHQVGRYQNIFSELVQGAI